MRAVLTAVMCVLAMAAGGACSGSDKGGGHLAPTPRDRMVLIVLSMKPTGPGGERQCDYDAPHARAYSLEKVTFRIVNRCDANQEVDLDFGKGSPFRDAPPYRASVPQGGAGETLKLTVKDHGHLPSSVLYPYGINLNGQPRKDPAFEVDPF